MVQHVRHKKIVSTHKTSSTCTQHNITYYLVQLLERKGGGKAKGSREKKEDINVVAEYFKGITYSL